MTTGVLAADGVVAFAGIMMVLAPAVSKPTVAFGIRVPPERTRAPCITAARRVYTVRAAAVGACCTVAAFLLPGGAPAWLPRLVLPCPPRPRSECRPASCSRSGRPGR
jgi:hypothetical protein